MTDASNPKSRIFSRIAWATSILCVACCAIPFLGITAGSAALAATALYSEKAAIVVAAIGVAILAYKRITRKNAPSCDLDCGCRPRLKDGEQRIKE